MQPALREEFQFHQFRRRRPPEHEFRAHSPQAPHALSLQTLQRLAANQVQTGGVEEEGEECGFFRCHEVVPGQEVLLASRGGGPKVTR